MPATFIANGNVTLDNGVVISRTHILTTNHYVVSAWAPCPVNTDGRSDSSGYSNITTIDGKWYGRLGTERLPAAIDALKGMSAERLAAVDAFHGDRYHKAYKAIHTAAGIIPTDARGITSSMGQVEFDL